MGGAETRGLVWLATGLQIICYRTVDGGCALWDSEFNICQKSQPFRTDGRYGKGALGIFHFLIEKEVISRKLNENLTLNQGMKSILTYFEISSWRRPSAPSKNLCWMLFCWLSLTCLRTYSFLFLFILPLWVAQPYWNYNPSWRVFKCVA